MKKQYRDISEFTVKKSKVMILGISFMLSSVVAEAAQVQTDCSFQSVEVVEETTAIDDSHGEGDFKFSATQDKWNLMLDDLAEYTDNWDGDGARAIKAATIANCRRILNDASRYEAMLDDIFPTEFGTVCIQWYKPATDALVNVEVTTDRIAFYADEPGRDLYDFRPAPYGKESIDTLISVLESLS